MMNLRVDELDDQYSGDGDDAADYSWYVEEEKDDEIIDETESEEEGEGEDDEDDEDDEEEKYNISESDDCS
jgi:hypothetical protein